LLIVSYVFGRALATSATRGPNPSPVLIATSKTSL
jgi:hypothetical protein